MNQSTEFADRRRRLFEAIGESAIDAFLVTAAPNVRYLSGFTGSNGAVLLTRDRALLFTDPRYQTQAPLESDCDVKIVTGPLLGGVLGWLKRLRAGSLGFERNRVSFETFELLRGQAKGVRLKAVSGAVEQLRMLKSPGEIATIRTSVELNSAAFAQALRHFKAGMKETDLAAEIEYRMRRLGADGPAFETIVASGERTALPHARPTGARIAADQLLLIDMGATVAGYASDMTRTLAVGSLNGKARGFYGAVLESQLAAIDAVRPGIACGKVDQAARRVLKQHGIEKLFLHSTGHGLGLEIHEGPRIGRKELARLEEGMAITVEPGVYLEGFGGIRIEDTVVVTANGCSVLTPTPKELVVL